jgi:tRNA dimethylallyltransferase
MRIKGTNMRKSESSSKPYTLSIIPQASTIYIVGPTASGKTALSIKLAQLLDAEIICADSQTVRRGMDIGTAKPTLEERAGIEHHCLDLIDPYDDFSLEQYLACARRAITEIHARGKIAIVVGGTGLFYLFTLPDIDADGAEQKQTLLELSVDSLQERIQNLGLVMPENSRNKRHLVNTLLRNGAVGQQHMPEQGSLIIGVRPPRDVLLARIEARSNAMIAAGFFDEVRAIVQKFGRPSRPFDAIAYRIGMRVIDGEITEAEAQTLMAIADRQYAKRQLSWFKRNEHIRWFEDGDSAYEFLRTSFLHTQ